MNRIPWQVHVAIAAFLVLLQTTIFRFIEIREISPDLVLIFLVFSANSKGSYYGQISSFTAGVIEDILSLAPLGFNSLIRTVIGYLSGKTKGKILFDPILMPLLYILVATILKEALTFAVSALFMGMPKGFFHSGFLIQICFNIVVTPVIYNVFRKLKIFGDLERDRL